MPWRRRREQAGPSADEFLEREYLLAEEVSVTDGEDDFLSAFTSREALQRFAPEVASAVPFSGANLLKFLMETNCAGVVINPGDPDDPEALVISRAAAEEIVGPSFENLWAGPTVLLAQPDEPPPPVLAEALRSACERDPQVAAAYVFLAAAPGAESHPQAVLGLELAAGDEISDELISALHAASVPPADVAAGLGGYAALDVHVLDEKMLDGVRELGIPIYRRPTS